MIEFSLKENLSTGLNHAKRLGRNPSEFEL